ncbi:MAG: UbiA family prenyltransferase [Planctomycetes bacterium]|nr:UbiA family prenyltransferase [Planctomycetota bacterium]
MNKALGLLKLTRFPLVFTAVADSAAGFFLTRGVEAPYRWGPLSLLAVVSACLYAAGMVYNDLADRVQDKVLHPERPLPSKQVTPQAAQRFGRILLLIAISGACVLGLWAALWTLCLIVLILGYTYLAKHVRGAGPSTMASVRGLNLGLGAFGALFIAPGATVPPDFRMFPWPAMATLGIYVFLLTLLSTHEEGNPRPQRVAWLGAGMAATPAVGLVLFRPWWNLASLAPALFVAPWLAAAAMRPDREHIMRAVRWGVLAIILIDASLVAGSGRWKESVAIAVLLAPALALLPLFRRL